MGGRRATVLPTVKTVFYHAQKVAHALDFWSKKPELFTYSTISACLERNDTSVLSYSISIILEYNLRNITNSLRIQYLIKQTVSN